MSEVGLDALSLVYIDSPYTPSILLKTCIGSEQVMLGFGDQLGTGAEQHLLAFYSVEDLYLG